MIEPRRRYLDLVGQACLIPDPYPHFLSRKTRHFSCLSARASVGALPIGGNWRLPASEEARRCLPPAHLPHAERSSRASIEGGNDASAAARTRGRAVLCLRRSVSAPCTYLPCLPTFAFSSVPCPPGTPPLSEFYRTVFYFSTVMSSAVSSIYPANSACPNIEVVTQFPFPCNLFPHSPPISPRVPLCPPVRLPPVPHRRM